MSVLGIPSWIFFDRCACTHVHVQMKAKNQVSFLILLQFLRENLSLSPRLSHLGRLAEINEI